MSSNSTPLNPGIVTAAAFIVAALGVAGAFNSYQTSIAYAKQFPDAYGGSAGQERFAAFNARVPASAEVGYFTDLDPSRGAYTPAFLSAQLALAPRVVKFVNGPSADRPQWALGNFTQPGDFAAAGNARGYTLVADLGNGVVLYRR
jgi:hypothetical protein